MFQTLQIEYQHASEQKKKLLQYHYISLSYLEAFNFLFFWIKKKQALAEHSKSFAFMVQ